MNAPKRQRGQTLVETLISLAVISIILSMTTALYIQMFNHYSKTSSDIDAQSEARFAMGRVTQSLRQAMTSPILPPGPPVSYPTAPPAGATPALGLTVSFTDASTIPSNADYRNAVYQNVTIGVSASPPPGHTYPNLVVTTTDINGNPTGSAIIGRDIKVFNVYAVTPSIYDVQITVAPPVGLSQGGGTQNAGYTLNSRVFISYYQ
jgi:prepilin-type N-terminal cleavage/methylation domain-containing protein